MTKKTSTSNEKVFDFRSIKTFEDACKKLGIEPEEAEIKAVQTEAVKSMKAYYKLVIIFLAINNGWKPDWSDYNQYKNYPWFGVLSSGFGFGVSDFVCAYSSTLVGSRLCTDTREKALYVAEQFKDLYQEYLLYSE
jgi:hypothetical protein